MFAKGDIVLVSSPLNPYAGFVGTVKKVKEKSHKLIIKFHKNKNTAWLMQDEVIKITMTQQKQLENIEIKK